VKLAMTLLVRDEQDIVAANLDYHLGRGVDLVIATDNGSVDATVEILRGYEARGAVRLLLEPADDYAQSRWVTRMARLAAAEGTDWVINCDADEFWWPSSAPDLKGALAQVPPEVGVVRARRHNFPPGSENGRPFFERMPIRDLDSRNPLGRALPPKAAHRAHPEVTVSMGNHRVTSPGLGATADTEEIEILHFPMRTYPQFENKIVKGGQALAANTELPPGSGRGRTWRHLYEDWRRGRLADHYEQAMLRDEQPPAGFIEDTRLRDFLRALPDRELSQR
jgi:hypothetical protein